MPRGRQNVLDVLAEEGFDAVCLDTDATEYGSVKTYEDAVKCAVLLRENRDAIDGIIITLPNFGDERQLLGQLYVWAAYLYWFMPTLIILSNGVANRRTASVERSLYATTCGNMAIILAHGSHTVDPLLLNSC